MAHRFKVGSFVVGVVLLIPMLLTACGPTSSTSSGGTPVKGGSLVDGLFEEPDSLLPGVSSETFADMVDQAIWDPLIRVNNQNQAIAVQATEVPSTTNSGISTDGKTITFHLKTGLKYSNGEAEDATNCVTTMKLLTNPNVGLKSALDVSDIASYSAPDPQTFVIQLKHVEPPFMANGFADPVYFVCLPHSIFDTMSAANYAKSSESFAPSVTNGPYMIPSGGRVKGDHITVVRNTNYPGTPGYLDQITFKIIANQDTLLAALQSGEVQTAWDLDINKLDSYRAISGYTQVLDGQKISWEALFMNEANPILADPVVRKAIMEGIHYSDILALWKGTASQTCDDATGTFGHQPQLIPCYATNTSDAGNILTQDGWVMGSDGYRHKGGKTLELRYTTTSSKTYRVETQQIVAQDLKPLGIKIDIVGQTADVFFGTTLYNYSSYDLAEFASSSGLDPDNHTYFMCNQFTTQPGGFNVSHYCNPAVDAQYNIELTNPNQSARAAAFTAIYTQLAKDLPVIYYYNYADIAVHKDTVHNYLPAGSGETWNIAQWWCSGGSC